MLKKYFMIVLVLILMPAAMAKSGSIKLLAVTNTGEELIGSVADMELEIKEGTGRVFIDSLPLSRLDTQISTRFAKEVACNFLERDFSRYNRAGGRHNNETGCGSKKRHSKSPYPEIHAAQPDKRDRKQYC